MFLSYKDTQEKINYLKNTKDIALNRTWLIQTLEQLNRKAERYEGVLSTIANIDTLFLQPNGEEREWDDKEALQAIEKLVLPIWEEVANRKGNFPTSDIDWKEVEENALYEIVYHHARFGEMTKEQLDTYLGFIATVLFRLNGFEVWEAENVFNSEDNEKWNEQALALFSDLLEKKNEIENEIILQDLQIKKYAVGVCPHDEDNQVKIVAATNELEAMVKAVGEEESWGFSKGEIPFHTVDEGIDFYLQGDVSLSKPVVL